MNYFLKGTLMISRCMDWIGGTALVLMMLLTSLDVVMRYMGKPIIGAYDLVLCGAAFVFGLALPRTSWDRQHVTVDVFVDWLKAAESKTTLLVLNIFNRCIALVFFVLLTWNFLKLGLHYANVGESTLTIGIPYYPMAYLLMFCCLVQCLVLISEILRIVFNRGASCMNQPLA
jgi:TRAP-type C4-dicarboxylate transport system permease small subunit